MKKISAFARKKKIGLHLDGARMYLASAYTGIAPATYSALFDTVYVSLYKYFNAPFGAILAGPAKLVEAAVVLRHQFGGGVLHGWESAAVALHYLDGFEETATRRRCAQARNLFRRLEEKSFGVHRMEAGTNIFRVDLPSPADSGFQARLLGRGIAIGKPPAPGSIDIQVNETILRRSTEPQIAHELVSALSDKPSDRVRKRTS